METQIFSIQGSNDSYAYDLESILLRITSISRLLEIIRKCKHIEIFYKHSSINNPPEERKREVEISNDEHNRLLEFLKKNKTRYATTEAFRTSRYLSRLGHYSDIIRFICDVIVQNSIGTSASAMFARTRYFIFFPSNIQRIILHSTIPLSFVYEPEILLLL